MVDQPRTKGNALREEEIPETLLDRVQSALSQAADGRLMCATVHDAALFDSLLAETARLAIQQDDSDLLLIADARTLPRLPFLERVAQKTRRVLALHGGNLPPGLPEWAIPVSSGLLSNENDRVLILLSAHISLALFAWVPGVADSMTGFHGGWTVQRSTVSHLAESLAGKHFKDAHADQNPPDSDRISSAAMRLATMQTEALELREKGMREESGDMRAALGVIKAISETNKAHEILYLFVEHLSRIVDLRRCSIVHVAPGEPHGLVLASHEDSGLSGRQIDLDKYPEITEALRTSAKVVIDDVQDCPVTRPFGGRLREAGIDALLVMPITRGRGSGTLLLRAARRGRPFLLREINFFEVVGEAAANALEKARLFDGMRQANRRLERLAITDDITGAYNRRYFHMRFGQEFERAARYKLPFSCLMLDLDDFKSVNDTEGHLAGDSVLREFSERVQGCIRRVDILARLGGEEFAVLLPQTGLEGALVEADRILEAVNGRPFGLISPERTITVSVGAAAYDPDTMPVGESLLKAADSALYLAKARGKNRVVAHNKKESEP